jgi:hypothetical protein
MPLLARLRLQMFPLLNHFTITCSSFSFPQMKHNVMFVLLPKNHIQYKMAVADWPLCPLCPLAQWPPSLGVPFVAPLRSRSIFCGPPHSWGIFSGLGRPRPVGRGPQHVALSSDWAWPYARQCSPLGEPLIEVGGHGRLRKKRSELVSIFFVLADDA